MIYHAFYLRSHSHQKTTNIYIWVEQNNGNITDNVHISLLLWCWTDHLLPSVQPLSFLEWTCTSFEQSVVEFYTLLEEHVQVAEMLEVEICSNHHQNWIEWFSNVQVCWLCWSGKVLKFTFMLFKPWLNSSSCVNGGIVALENSFVSK
jgi:hypothetical protein